MARRLTAHERALWSRVAATVRPIGGRAPVVAAPPEPPAVAAPPLPRPRPSSPARPVPAPKLPPRAVADATLDGGWDRRLRHGDIRPDRVVDLHGYTLAAAHDRLMLALDDAAGCGDRIVLIVTGKGRGDRPGRIRAELNHWLETTALRSRIAALRPAHPRHGGGGAFYLILRRR